MEETYLNDLKKKLEKTNCFDHIVQKVLKTNYHKMNFQELKTEIDGLLDFYQRTKAFAFVWGAAVAYSANNSLDKYLLLPGVLVICNTVDMKRFVIAHCGELFREFPRLAYLKASPFVSDQQIRQFIRCFTNPANEKLLDFWRKADNSDAPADETTDGKVELLKELKMKCNKIDKQIDDLKQIKEEVLEIQQKLQQCGI